MKINLIASQKGGVGKTTAQTLLALKYQEVDSILFCDLDSSTKSSTQMLSFLKGKTPPRLVSLDLLDEKNRIIRDKILKNIEKISKLNYEKCFLDFGAPESEQLPSVSSPYFSTRVN